MSFFLLAKHPDGSLELVTERSYETRQDALAELATLTSEPGFDLWESEVFALDLNTGAPVLLVRPVTVAPDAFAQTSVTDAAPVVEAEEMEPVPEDVEESADDEPSLGDTDDSGEANAPEMVLDSVAEEAISEPSAADSSGPTVEPEPVVAAQDPEPEVVEEAPAALAGADSLRDAIMRTAAQMTSEGITPPPSINSRGVAEPASVYVDTTALTERSSQSEIDVMATQADDEDSASAPVYSQAWPWAVGSEAATSPELDASAPLTANEPEPFTLHGLEEPAIDSGEPLIRVAGDDQTMSDSRPVILGTYEAQPTIVDAEIDTDTRPDLSELAEIRDSELASETDPEPESDFILDLPPVTLPGYEPTASVDQESTCSDCIYELTCPNAGQRSPVDCGSFQWK